MFTLEMHDLVLSKVLRWYDGDVEQMTQLHSSNGLDRSRIKLNFLDMVRDLFGELEQVRARRFKLCGLWARGKYRRVMSREQMEVIAQFLELTGADRPIVATWQQHAT